MPGIWPLQQSICNIFNIMHLIMLKILHVAAKTWETVAEDKMVLLLGDVAAWPSSPSQLAPAHRKIFLCGDVKKYYLESQIKR